MEKRFFIVYCSPAGSTRHAAGVIERELARSGTGIVTLDLGMRQDLSRVLDSIRNAGSGACVFIGSPVYRDMAVPPVMKFIEMLEQTEGALAIPFVTWGAACSGVALWQMGAALRKKGFTLAGAAKVCAVHSMMWDVAVPAGQGHPNTADDNLLKNLATSAVEAMAKQGFGALPLEELDYQPDELKQEMKAKLSAPWTIIGKTVDEERCTQCGICQEACPADAITLNPFPEFDKSCFDCFNCIRLCPEEAIEPAIGMDKIHGHIRMRVKTFNEQPLSQIFTGSISQD